MMLENHVALVTGAGRGIGKAIALALADEGAFVVVNYNGSEARAMETVSQIQEKGGRAEAIRCNVADFAACREMVEGIISHHGRLDILVNNAGITRDNLLMKMSEEEFDAVIHTNLKGAFNCMKHISRQMIKQRSGRIINISSVSGVAGNASLICVFKCSSISSGEWYGSTLYEAAVTILSELFFRFITDEEVVCVSFEANCVSASNWVLRWVSTIS